MKTRRFSLESVLDLRAALKERAEDHLAVALRHRDHAASHHAVAVAELANIAQQLGEGRFSASKRRQGWDALQAQEQHCQDLKSRLVEAEKEVGCRREQLIAAARDFDLLDRLKQKWRETCLAAERRADERVLDDFVGSRRALHLASTSHA